MTTHEKLIALLDQHGAQYRLLEHAANGKCEAVAALRGTEVGQGAKALVCHVKGNGIKQYVLAVLPADRQADLSKVAAAVGGRRASLASPAEVDALTERQVPARLPRRVERLRGRARCRVAVGRSEQDDQLAARRDRQLARGRVAQGRAGRQLDR